MRAVVQRVSEARVAIEGALAAEIGPGALVLLGVGREDDEPTARRLARRIVALRFFDDESGRMNRSLLEVGGELLVVSQFTLWADCRSGRRPSWSRAAAAAQAEPLYRAFLDEARGLGVRVAEGRFGARMEVALVNQGPVTLLLD